MALPLLARTARAGQLRQLSTTAVRAAEVKQIRGPRTPRPQGLRKHTGPAVPAQGLPELINMLTQLKVTNRQPKPAAYLALMGAAADYANRRGNNKVETAEGEAPVDESVRTLGFEIALGAMRDAEAGGIDLGDEALDILFRFATVHPDILPSLLIELSGKSTASSAAGNTLANAAIANRSLEELLVVTVEMLQHNLTPKPHVVRNLIRMLCEWGLPRLALQLVRRIEVMPQAPKIDTVSWINILTASADSQYLEGVEVAWANVVNTKAFSPDEGLILAVLAVAGRWGRTGLASQALDLLPSLNVEAQEHHMAPLLEAFCNEGRVPDALKVVSSLRASGINPTLSTVRPIIRVLSKNTEIVDQAFYALEDMHKEGEVVDVAALNAVIAASARLGDLQRARATQLAAADLDVTPTIDTFNLVLEACSSGRHRHLADTLLKEIAEAGLQPNEVTYEAMVGVCLSEVEYEDAFHYLERMKAEGFKPSKQIYLRIGFKCARNNDSRWKLVAEEMAQVGYRPRDFGADADAGKGRGLGEGSPRRMGLRGGGMRRRQQGGEGEGGEGGGQRRSREPRRSE